MSYYRILVTLRFGFQTLRLMRICYYSDVYCQYIETHWQIALRDVIQFDQPVQAGWSNPQILEQVKSFKYLGSIVNGNNSVEEEIKGRISLGNKAFYANQDLFKSKLLNKNSKLRMYKTLVRPLVTCL